MTIPARELFGLSLIAVQLLLAGPIILKLLRSRERKGFSLAGEIIWVAAGAGWALYGLLFDSTVLIISGSIAALTSGAISILIWNYSPKKMAIICGLGTVAVLGLGTFWGGKEGLSMSLAFVGAVQFLPQLVKSLRMLKNGERAGGVSVLGSGMRSLYTLSWAVYGGAWFLWGAEMTRIDWPLVGWGLAGAVAFFAQACSGIGSRSRPCSSR